MPSSFARVTRSDTRESPSSRLYSLWVWRWTNDPVMAILSPLVEAPRLRPVYLSARGLLCRESKGGDDLLAEVADRPQRRLFLDESLLGVARDAEAVIHEDRERDRSRDHLERRIARDERRKEPVDGDEPLVVRGAH